MTTTDAQLLPQNGQHGLSEHSHVGGRTLAAEGVASHLHAAASFAVDDHAVPTSKSEPWKFTPLRRLRGLHADAVFAPSAIRCEWDAPAGVTVRGTTGAEAAALRGSSGYVPTERFAARVLAETTDSLLVDIPAEAAVDELIRITWDGTDASVTEAGHVLIRVGRHANATVVLQERGSATAAHVIEFDVAEGASLNVVAIADWASDTVHLVHHAISLGRDARIKHSALTFGGEVSRLSIDVDYRAPGGDAELLGLYFADADQYLEHRIFADHTEPNCRSNVLYKGAVQGARARTAWVGDVLIRHTAEGTDTYEMNRNLLLTPGARADSVPNLEIETGEIAGAGHASTTGRFDDEHLFYLQSRGISPEAAKRLVVRGFFHEVLHKIGIPSVEEHIADTVERELAITGM